MLKVGESSIGEGRQASFLGVSLLKGDGERPIIVLHTQGLWDSSSDSKNSAVEAGNLLAQASSNCSLPSSGCGDAKGIIDSFGRN